ncbi:MAG TPA: GntR family transcriptional regulator [Caulobacteraceae bacterium]|jgi:GntR family transcriptional regulator|nr:GntR family transcriptional regulator [Caulobacteraceae bacterium]
MHTHQQAVLETLKLGSAGVPIYVQLRDQLLHAIGDGLLAPGDQMPTMREVAVALKVDLNTVRHAYDELERAGAIRLERGRGSFVADAPPTVDPPQRAAQTDTLARQILAMAAGQGVDPLDLAARISALAQSKEPNP